MKKKKIIFIIVIVIGLFCTSLLTFSFAKYAKNSFWDYYLKSQEFYLSSDDLVSENIVNRIWDGSKVYFNVKNSLNNELITDYDINYDVVCKVLNSDVETDCYINGTNSDTYSGVLSSNSFCVNDTGDNVDVNGYNKSDCEIGGYTWKNQEAAKNLYFELSNAEVTNAEVEIILTSTSPYSKELIGTFKLNKDENSGKEIDLLVTINNYVYPVEIKKSSNPGNKSIKNFDVVNKFGMNVGSGIVLCLCKEILAIDDNNYYVPIEYV